MKGNQTERQEKEEKERRKGKEGEGEKGREQKEEEERKIVLKSVLIFLDVWKPYMVVLYILFQGLTWQE